MKYNFYIFIVVIILIIATMITVSAANAINGHPNISTAQNEITEATDINLTPDELTETNDEQANEADLEEKTENIEATDIIVKERIDTDLWIAQNKVIHKNTPTFAQGDMKVYSAKKAQEKAPYSFTFLPKYRDIYYWAPTFLVDLVGKDSAKSWYDEVYYPSVESNSEPEEMYTVSFVKYFQISKEDFEEAAEKRRENIQELKDNFGFDVSGEEYEIHNADVIYTFDNELINNYYLRDQIGIKQTE